MAKQPASNNPTPPNVPPKMAERPHWSTFITPTASVLVAIVSLLMVIQNSRLSQDLNRPFVLLSFVQKSAPRSAPEQTSGDYGIVAAGILTIRNTGNSPAYNVDYVMEIKELFVARPSAPITLAAHDIKEVNPAACWAKHGYIPDFNKHITYNVSGYVTYHDSFGNAYKEPARFDIQVGDDTVTPNPFFR